MKVIFLGTSEFACNVLKKLKQSNHEVVAVVCGIDKPSGRGNKLTPPPAKVLAEQMGIPVYQFKKIRVDGVDTLKSIEADVMITASYGQILSQEIIDICKYKIINVHGSLLPKYRGASPIQTALMNGEKKTGITIMQTDAGIDTGDMIDKCEIDIDDEDTYETLTEKLSLLGGDLLIDVLNKLEKGQCTWEKQDDSLATHTKMIKKEDCVLDFNQSAQSLVNMVRALNPNPVAKFLIGMDSFKVFKLKACQMAENEPNGAVVAASNKTGLIIKCQDGAVEVLDFQPPSSKRMAPKSYFNGKKIDLGTIVND